LPFELVGEVKKKNILAAIVIVLVLVVGGLSLYRLDDGRSHRTDASISGKTASD
jgi:hypothetical protein